MLRGVTTSSNRVMVGTTSNRATMPTNSRVSTVPSNRDMAVTVSLFVDQMIKKKNLIPKRVKKMFVLIYIW